ncbi:GNAT family N-acetyltransferase [Alteromonas naphthalenivorans]|uniref:Cellulose biosynthesis protein CelD n=1 Tax=Alteromonas naphthalenivorans TaxID=715451 RepID=F5ZC28_ALTNA|nr:GNAT family N-acetyltransferase [Alteromonas naphthalenivorans]AEF02266.1 cellulose biosynthesis protein CelD [Alteromonas naphthalenivorans]
MNHSQSMYVIENLEELKKFKKNWLSLYSKAHVKNIFNSYEWVSIWAENYKRHIEQLFIITFEIRSELVAIIPLYIRKGDKSKLWYVGSGEPLDAESCSEGHDILCLTDEIRPNISLLRAVFSEYKIKNIMLTNIRQHSLLLKWIELERFKFIKNKIGFRFYSPTLPHDDKLAKKTVRGRRNADKLNLVIRRVETVGDLEKVFPSLVRLNSERWKEKGDKAIFENHTFRHFHYSLTRALLISDKLSMVLIEDKDEIIAVNYSIISGEDLIFYQNGVNIKYKPNISPGLILHHYQYCIAQSMKLDSYDFMTSADPNNYKKNITSHSEIIYELDVFLNINSYALSKAKSLSKHFFKRIISA